MMYCFKVVTFVAALLLFVGCGGEKVATVAVKIPTVATITPLGEFAAIVGGELTTVRMLLPPGADLHDWEPKAGDMRSLASAALLFYNGGGLEPWVEKIAANSGKTLFIETGRGLFAQRTQGQTDAHIWLDPLSAVKQVEAIKEAFCLVDSKNRHLYEKNATAYINELTKLHSEYNALSAKTKGRAFVTLHTAFGYAAARYGWEEIALLGLEPHAEPSPADMSRVLRLIDEKKVKYVFYEPGEDERIMREIASQNGLELLPLDSLEVARQGSYLQRMRKNLESLRKAFGE